MSQQVKPIQLPIKGIDLSGNPTEREPGTASIAQDVRIMPGKDGGWLRLKGGRLARINATSGTQAYHMIASKSASPGDPGPNDALMLASYSAGSVLKMVRIKLDNLTLDETGPETIDTGNDDDNNFYAHATLPNSIVFDNGKGVTKGGAPSLTQWMASTTVRYFGLDVLETGAGLSVSFSSGGSNINQVFTAVKIYVGVHNTVTQHYSNAIYAGEITTTGGTGYITVSGLDNLLFATHGATETAEQKFVFYATIDGLRVPYLIFNADLDGPLTTAVSNTSMVLDVSSGTVNGWVLDTTKEMPTRNYAPRRMKSLCYANGRLYGILSPGAVLNAGGDYQVLPSDLPCATWSEAEGSTRTVDFLGDPLESWPLNNLSAVPSGENPIHCFPAPNNMEVIYFTPTHTLILREQVDGVHEWDTISNEHGLDVESGYRSVVNTRHGVMWVTQRRQFAMYTNEGEFKIVSAAYDAALLVTEEVTCAAYVYDPINLVDRFQCYVTARGNTYCKSICHDFNTGVTTTIEPHYVYAARSLTYHSSSGPLVYHFVAASIAGSQTGVGLYSIEGQPDVSGLVVKTDQIFTSTSGTSTTVAQLSDGYWAPNWNCLGDPNVIKQINFVDFIGDGAVDGTLGASPITVAWVAGFQAVTTASGTSMAPIKMGPETADLYYRCKVTTPHHNYWKFIVRIRCHAVAAQYYPRPALEGDQSTNFYCAIAKLLLTVGQGEQRIG